MEEINERQKALFWTKIKRTNYCWEWIGLKTTDGYGSARIGKEITAHRVAYQLIYGKIDKGEQILHKCDNPSCCNPDHLWVGNHQINMKDKYLKKRSRMFGRSSLYYGVGWRNDSKCWRSYIMINKKLIHLKCFDNELDAAKYHDKISVEKGIYEKLNFPENWMPLPSFPSD